MFLEKDENEKTRLFVQNLLETNRGFNFYVDWENITGIDDYAVEIEAINVLIGKNDETFKNLFVRLLATVPRVIAIFPFLFALSKEERKSLVKGKDELCLVGEEIDCPDYDTYSFCPPTGNKVLSNDDIERYYNFFTQMGLKKLYQKHIQKSTRDYIVGVLVGLDSNGRKNRGGHIFELACQPIIERICHRYSLNLMIQKKMKKLRPLGFNISEDIAERKADFIVYRQADHKAMNIEVNFYNDNGSKPEEIIDSYINRQTNMRADGVYFCLVTDGRHVWSGSEDGSNQLKKGFRYMRYLLNFSLMKNGVLEEVVRDAFNLQ